VNGNENCLVNGNENCLVNGNEILSGW